MRLIRKKVRISLLKVQAGKNTEGERRLTKRALTSGVNPNGINSQSEATVHGLNQYLRRLL